MRSSIDPTFTLIEDRIIWLMPAFHVQVKQLRNLHQHRKELKQLAETFGIGEQLWNKAQLSAISQLCGLFLIQLTTFPDQCVKNTVIYRMREK